MAPLLLITLISSAAFATAAPLEKKLPWLGNDELSVSSYDLRIVVPEMKSGLQVNIDEKITLTLLKPGKLVKLHMEEQSISINKIKLGSKELKFNVLEGIPSSTPSHLTGSVLSVELPKAVKAGAEVTLALEYLVKPDESGKQLGMSFQENFLARGPILNTRNWPYYARYWLPSNDHPSNPARFHFEIHVPDGFIAAANGVLEEGDYESGSGLDSQGLRVFKWNQDDPLMPYGVNVAIAKFQVEHGDFCIDDSRPNSIPVDCAENKKGMSAVFYHVNSKKEFENTMKLGESAAAFFTSVLAPYPWKKLGFVQAPFPFNMESASLITLVDSDSTVHEVAHHWWGNSVRIKSWGDLWISEGFTTYYDGLYHEFVDGKNNACKGKKPPSFAEDTDPLKIFNNTPYCSGSASLADLRERLANLAEIEPDSVEARTLILALLREHYSRAKGKAMSTEEFVAFVKQNSLQVLKREGYIATQNKVDHALSEWAQNWFPARP